MKSLSVVTVTAGHALACPPKNWRIKTTESVEDAIAAIRATPASIVILDRDAAGPDWRPALRRIASEPNCASVILASHVVDDYLWEEVIQQGGFDVIATPLQERELLHMIEFAWAATKSRPFAPHTR